MVASLGRCSLVCVAAGLLVSAPAAHADKVDRAGERLADLDAEIDRLGQGIKVPDEVYQKSSSGAVSRRLVDARLLYSVGNYDDAAVKLYDLVERYPTHPNQDEAMYYLAESLFQKGDSMAARSYFTRLVREKGNGSKYYRQGLERLLELTLRLDDNSDASEWLAMLDQLPAGELRDSVPYVRGKYHYFRKQYDVAIPFFEKVPPTSQYYFQTRYFLGASLVGVNKLREAQAEFQKLLTVDAKTNDHKRIHELTQMALGRLHYERDQPSQAIDRYLMIDRKSDLFDEALFEVGWVYIKNKQFNKALRALELLAISDPDTARMPEVRILEGNLRIRKAKEIEAGATGNAVEQYGKALEVFEQTKDSFKAPHEQLVKLAADRPDASVFMAQVTGRVSDTFETKATLPEVAATWLRNEPGVKRIVKVEDDLAEIATEIKEAERTIERIELAIGGPNRVNIFPSLATKRSRSTEILEELVKLQTQVLNEEYQRVVKYASAGQKSQINGAVTRRKQLQSQFKDLPNAELSHGERVQRARGQFEALDQEASKIRATIQGLEAQVVAIERFVADGGATDLSEEKRAEVAKGVKEMRAEIEAMKNELAAARREALLARDRAGTSDEAAMRAEQLRKQLRQALAAEHAALQAASSAARGGDAAKARQIATFMQRASTVNTKVDQMNRNIDQIVNTALDEVRRDLMTERSKLAAYKAEFLTYETESHDLGGEVLGNSFDAVAEKFYGIVIRSDVGIVDVAWSRQEDADQRQRRLTLDQARERRTLDAEFSDVIREMRAQKQRELESKSVQQKLPAKIADPPQGGPKTIPAKKADPPRGGPKPTTGSDKEPQ